MKFGSALAFALCCALSSNVMACPDGPEVQIVGDTPGAISYDVYSHLYPLRVTELARMQEAQQVFLIPDGTRVCSI